MTKNKLSGHRSYLLPVGCAALALGLTAPTPALRAGDEADAKASKAVVEKKPEPRIKFSGYIEGGFTGNPSDPNDHQNFGRVFDDRANEPMLNQVTLTVERALAPGPGKWDWGFKIQGGGGSDGRFINTTGTLENVTHYILQPYLTEAYGSLHIPVLTEGGLDLKLGQFVTLLGAETIDPRTNYFYSHEYIFNFAIPFQHLGALATLHVNKTVDLYSGITRGVNTSIYDNNQNLFSYIGGIGFNLLDGKLTILATTHIGAENPTEFRKALAFHNSGRVNLHDPRYYGNTVVTWKITDKLTSITDASYTYDAGFDTDCYGVAETLVYALNDKVSIALRGEAFRDSDGFYVAQFARHDDFTNIERGVPSGDPRTVSGGANTYLAATVGVNIKPISRLTVRPELRFDYATQNRAFDDSSKRYQFTAALDAIVTF